MGAYLSEPIVEKLSSEEKSEYVIVGSSSMQGWRKNQEDAHNCILDFDGQSSFFAVYDGHGGAEVAIYCAEQFPAFLKALESYKSKNFEKALKDAFIGFDATLLRDEVVEILKKMANEQNGEIDDEDDEEEDLNELCYEGALPLHKVLEKYKEAAKLPQLNKLKDSEPTAGGSGSSKPQSPFLRGRKEFTDNANSEEVEGSSEVKESDTSDESKPSKVSENNSHSSGSAGSSAKDETDIVTPRKTNNSQKRSAAATAAAGSPNKSTDKKVADVAADEDASSSDSDADFQECAAEDDSSTDDCEEASEEENEDDEEEDEDGEEEDAFCANMIEEPGKDSGCTAVVALLIGRDLYVANAGDSRCVVCRSGKAIEMSMDHKPEDDEESSRILKAGGKVTLDGRVNGGLNLSRAIGDHAYKMNDKLSAEEQMISALPDVKKLTISHDDEFMILACDGIWNYMSSEEVVKFVKKRIDDGSLKMSEICEELFDNCLAPNTMGDGTGCDNMTAVIIKFKEAILELPTELNLSENNGDEITDNSEGQSQQSKKRKETDDGNDASESNNKRAKTITEDETVN